MLFDYAVKLNWFVYIVYMHVLEEPEVKDKDKHRKMCLFHLLFASLSVCMFVFDLTPSVFM